MEDILSHSIRLEVFHWLQSIAPLKDNVLNWNDLTRGFKYKGKNIVLIGAKGIWKPKEINQYPISISSVQKSYYQDRIIDDNTLHYSYRGTDRNHYDNIALRESMNDKIPLVYMHQIAKGKYFVAWPTFIVKDEPERLRFLARVESDSVINNSSIEVAEPEAEYRQKYTTRNVLVRLHQQSFREEVLKAYRDHCAICSLKHRELLDAAHIIPDNEQGKPIVTNGLSLCKIHHAAFDQNILGINPDYYVEIREDILEEIDGPMLKYGLQSAHQQKIILPRKEVLRPNKEWLDIRYQRFKDAG